MARDQGAPEAEQLPRAWNRRRREAESPKGERLRVRCWAVQDEISGFLGRMAAGAAGRILDSAFS